MPPKSSFIDRAKKIFLANPHNLACFYKEELRKSSGKKRWELMKEIGHLIEAQSELAAYAAHIQKEIIDSLTDGDLQEMGISKERLETDLNYSVLIVPLAERHDRCQQRKDSSCQLMASLWGDDWQTLMNDLLPPFTGETFLRDLTIYAKKNPWNIAEPFFRSQIRKRLAIPYTKKCRWLISRDITGKGTAGTKKRRTGSFQPKLEATPPPTSPTTISHPNSPTNSTSQTPPPPTSPTTISHPNSPTNSTSQTPPPITSVPPSRPSLPSNDPIEGSSGRTVQSHDEQCLQGLFPARCIQQAQRGKKRRLDREETIRRKYKVEVSIIDLDVEERIQEIEKERAREQDEEKINEISAALMAAKDLLLDVRDEQGRIDKEKLEKRLERLLEIFVADVDISID